MKKFIITFLIFIVCLQWSWADELFINTDPIGADIFFGKKYVGKAPYRLRDFTGDTVKVLIQKKGYEVIKDTVQRTGARSQLQFYNLVPLSVDLVLNQEGKGLYMNDVHAGKTPLLIKNIPGGVYEIQSRKGKIYISNAANARLKRTVFIETLFTAGFFLVSAGGAAVNNSHGDADGKLMFTVSSLIFGGLTGYNLMKLAKVTTDTKKNRFNMSAVEITPFRGEEDREIFSSGMGQIGKQSWADARAQFNLLLNIYPGSSFVPLSLYEIGYCYFSEGNFETASDYFLKYLHDYPAYEFFQYAFYYLLETEMLADNYDRAVSLYREIRPLYINDASGGLYEDFYTVLTNLYDRTSDKIVLQDLLGEINYYLDNNRDSDRYPYMLLLKGRLLYGYLDREAGNSIFTDIREHYGFDKELLAEMEKVLNE